MRLLGPAGQPLAAYIAEVAANLFYREGIHGVGIDRIADTVGVTKRTIHHHYRSRDELIAAALRHAPRVRFPAEGTSDERIMGVFALLRRFLQDTRYRGCPYIIFSAELTATGHPARRLIERRLQRRRQWFRERAIEAGLAEAEEVAEELDVLFDGALASGAKRGDLAAPQAARRVVTRILAQAKRQGIARTPPAIEATNCSEFVGILG
jgi:AcrR family transcriptional regulator